MTHKFKDEIIDWLNGGEYEFVTVNHISGSSHGWHQINQISCFDIAEEVRKVDEYKHLRAALERGETLQALDDDGLKWIDIDWEPSFIQPANEYRIKPKTKKMVQWLIKNDSGEFLLTNNFYAVGIEPSFIYAEAIKPLPHTEIEVEE